MNSLLEAMIAAKLSGSGGGGGGGSVTSVNGKTGAVMLGVDDGFAVYVTPEQFGAKGDGETDDTLAIQAALDAVSNETSDRNNTGNGVLYMADKVYRTTAPLIINSNVHMKCDGRILYEGNDSAVIVDGRYSFVELAMISAPNGTGLEFAASRHNHETMTNSVRVDRIRPCKRGIYLHDHEGEHAVTTNYIYCDQIDSGGGSKNPGTYGIEVFADHHWLTEIHYYIGHVMNFQIGVYVHSSDYEDSASVLELRAGAQRFHRIQIEGTPGAETICGIKVHNSGGLHFHDTRLNENFGQNQVVLSGKVQRCEFNLDFVDLRKIDFSGVTKASANWFRGLTYNSGGYTHFGYEYCLTNNPSGDGTPCMIPTGRTAMVRIGIDSYKTVIDLATIGFAVQAVMPGVANTGNGAAYNLARIDRENEIVYFAGVYPTPSMNSCSLVVYKLENQTDSSGNPVWTNSTGSQYFQMQKDRVTSIMSSSTDSQYPTAKAVWGLVSDKADASDVSALASRLNALADSDDTTLDQLSEIVAYIKNNKTLIDNITTGKVSVSDIVDNLTSTATNKPLSANQGRALKALIDAIVVPTESTVSGWGFTKNTGTYSKPSGGIPKTDLASDVQTSLGKADKALQQHQSLSGYATETWVNDKGYLTLEDLPIYNGGVS